MGKARQQPGSCLAADVLRADVTSENGAAVHQVSGLGLRVSRTHSHLRKRLISHVKEGSAGPPLTVRCSAADASRTWRQRPRGLISFTVSSRSAPTFPEVTDAGAGRECEGTRRCNDKRAAPASAPQLRQPHGVLAPRDPSFAQGALV